MTYLVAAFARYDKVLNESEFTRWHFLDVPFQAPHRLLLFRRFFRQILFHHRFTLIHSQSRHAPSQFFATDDKMTA